MGWLIMKMYNKIPFLSVVFAILLIFFLGVPVHAETVGASKASDFLAKTIPETGLSTDEAEVATGKLINRALGLAGIAFLILTVYAGFRWMTAQGNEDQVTKARETLTASLIGIAVILLAFSVSTYIIGRLQSTVGGTQGPDGGYLGGENLGCCIITADNEISWTMETKKGCGTQAGDGNWNYYEQKNAAECSNLKQDAERALR